MNQANKDLIKNIKDLKSRIEQKASQMSAMQKRISDYIVEHPENFALKNIRDLAEELKTSKSSIVRLAQLLGYKGFHELKRLLLKSISHEFDPIYRYKQSLTVENNRIDILETIAEEMMQNIQVSLTLVDREQYEQALQILKTSRHLYTIGRGISTYMAELAAYLINRVGIKALSLVHSGINFSEQIVSFGKNDVLMAFSFPPYTPETIHACEFAREKGLKVISITDKITAPVIQFSDVYLQVSVDTSTMSNSMSSVLVLIYSIATQLGKELRRKTISAIESIEHLRKKHAGN